MAQAAEVTCMAERKRRRPDAAEQRRRGESSPASGASAPRVPGAEAEQGRPTEFVHVPVMLQEVLRFAQPAPGQILVDATLGGGGHAAAVLPRLGPDGRLIGIDQDPAASAAASEHLRPLAAHAGVRLDVVRANFAALEDVLDDLGIPAVDGVYFDLGVSSHQLDAGERGFSYREDAALDMRMDPEQQTTAYHLVNGLSEQELADLILQFGEERWARRIAHFIVRRRQDRGLISTTGELVEVIKEAVPVAVRRDGPHPARRTFLALRIAVNNELGALEAALRAAAHRLRPGGRLVAISFHSLEDRIVKHVIRELAADCTCPPEWPVCRCGARPMLRPLLPRPLTPTPEEAAGNPRARSAKLRAALRLDVEASAGDGEDPWTHRRESGRKKARSGPQPPADGRGAPGGFDGRASARPQRPAVAADGSQDMQSRAVFLGSATAESKVGAIGPGISYAGALMPSVAETLYRGRRRPVLDIRRGE